MKPNTMYYVFFDHVNLIHSTYYMYIKKLFPKSFFSMRSIECTKWPDVRDYMCKHLFWIIQLPWTEEIAVEVLTF